MSDISYIYITSLCSTLYTFLSFTDGSWEHHYEYEHEYVVGHSRTEGNRFKCRCAFASFLFAFLVFLLYRQRRRQAYMQTPYHLLLRFFALALQYTSTG